MLVWDRPATAERLASGGWRVYATARRTDSIADLAERGCETLVLDVTDEASMRTAVDAVEAAEGAVGVLVNNAGYSQSGAMESVPLDRIHTLFDDMEKASAYHWGEPDFPTLA